MVVVERLGEVVGGGETGGGGGRWRDWGRWWGLCFQGPEFLLRKEDHPSLTGSQQRLPRRSS